MFIAYILIYDEYRYIQNIDLNDTNNELTKRMSMTPLIMNTQKLIEL